MYQQFIHYCIGYDRECQVFRREDGKYIVNGISIETQDLIDQQIFDDLIPALEWANQWI